ncbi:MAG: hypothetical protein A2087_11640 [Spirochaetes bacterium GWD1_61_31]|nr:MAG: hypothetical protein A2Y37_14870 [Spirochaetes bacterium GWB1_60_80]OHD30315.1 MAG: hypothetical protein A2004_02855 [Spirochaetes bacterium GWC1_61_12]OHD35852.1 MAG: hypothetical protein A2087_11640 [Spirochaetes bacterium GWD1_61_31]OHD46794.1 MAG: hypothetical protein A2Y35_10810 [Spirochaetes bacterium GWE1_60_18]OHD61246.1 MAG: hypothetical protein A2Y32_13105 [Spirochaetes bacterium GWF1_60_12]HAP42994.1 hypothetical protein [Spirochaetaceae bacterium]
MATNQGDRPSTLPRRLDDGQLLNLVRERPAGWKVHELSSAVDKLDLSASDQTAFGQPQPDQTGAEEAEPFGDLRLFRRNFLLMRQLFQLRRCLRAERAGDLCISSMDIRFCQPVPATVAAGTADASDTNDASATSLPDSYDGLEAYYLEEANYHAANQASVQELLDDFWRRLERWRQRDAALAAWDIDPTLPYEAVKQRILDLAKQHHPDGGGDAAAFRSLWRFWEAYRDRATAAPRPATW